ncbi:MAG: glycerate kinase, partial [Solirubrobacterales bacterium]|nr:glycerate kinase [Solirubrobacterales bacterium]
AAAAAVVVGEGRLDAQSLQGKVPGELARLAAAAGVPCHAIVGSASLEDLGALASVRVASTLTELEAAGHALGRTLR